MDEIQSKMQQVLDQYKTLCAQERDLVDAQRDAEKKLIDIRVDIARMQGALSAYQEIRKLLGVEGGVIAVPETNPEVQKKTEIAPATSE